MKHLARKHVNGSSQQQANKFLRVSQCKEEVYAYIMRLLGNSMCMVKCVDGYERLCHIRGKFTGRSKRENALSQGTWVLVGLRQWDSEKEFASKASKTEKNIQKCDLLQYTHHLNVKNYGCKKRYFRTLLQMVLVTATAEVTATTSSRQTIQWSSKTRKRWNIRRL